jgi:oligopeptide/dipeptide ABC transporter ATP-binding protein
MDLLEIEDLSVHFPTSAGTIRAVDTVSLRLEAGERLCLLGESGSGKTVVALAIVGLLPPSALVRGQIRFDGRDLLNMPRDQLRRLRGREIAMVFEQQWTCLNPVLPVGPQIAEAVRAAGATSQGAAREAALELMRTVGIPAARQRYRQYPHEFSGGMAQRAMIAIALAVRPSLLIADKPTTALDVTVQAQIIDLLADLLAQRDTTLLLITHDIDVGAALCQRMAVMYAGEIIEHGPLRRIIDHPRHPYTGMLMRAIGPDGLHPIPGAVPELTDLPAGCRFHPRCPHATDRCRARPPAFEDDVRCWLWSR